jgi:Spy/CpxP family protein refolding chaperone
VNPWKVILATMVIFGCGVVTGALLLKTQLPPAGNPDVPVRATLSTNAPPPWGQIQRLEFLRRMEKQLDLTQEQKDQITKIIKDSQERSRPIWEQIAPQMRQELRRTREGIRNVLTAEQQPKFDRLLKLRPRRVENAATNAP